MIERLIENWLTDVNERELEIPFCHLLTSQGHRVVHLTRHGEAEQGKDIISVDPEGRPCAFQLKSAPRGRITLKEWRLFRPQVEELVELPVVHPSIRTRFPHRAYLVTNGVLDEPVINEISTRNRGWKTKYHRRLETVVKGDILSRFNQLQTAFWPREPTEVNLLLELFLAAGEGLLDKEKLWKLLLRELPAAGKMPQTECARAISSAAVLCSYALTSFHRKHNHVALAEGWIIFIMTLLKMVEKRKLRKKLWHQTLWLATTALYDALWNLFVDVNNRTHLIQGDVISEAIVGDFRRARSTIVIGFLSAWALWLQSLRGGISQHSPDNLDVGRRQGESPPTCSQLLDVTMKYRKLMWVYGEAAVSHFLAYTWFLGRAVADQRAIRLLLNVLQGIARANGRGDLPSLADPYHGPDEIIRFRVLHQGEFEEEFHGQSYAAEALVMVIARRWGLRNELARIWPDVTRLSFCTFRPTDIVDFYDWRCEQGTHTTRFPGQPQSWRDLQSQASRIDRSSIPQMLQDRPSLLLFCTLVYPHRLTSEVAKKLDEWVTSLPHGDP